MQHDLDRRSFLLSTATFVAAGSSSGEAGTRRQRSDKQSPVIDHHVHVFPDQRGALGYDDPTLHERKMQAAIRSMWGRFAASHTDPKYIPEPDEDVGFTQGKYGIWRWRKHGEDCWIRRGPQSMTDPVHDPEQMLAHMDIVGVDMGVIQTNYMAPVWGREVYFADCIRRWPDRFIGTTVIDYDLRKSDKYLEKELETLTRAVEELGFRGLCENIPKGQPRDDPRCDVLWKACIRLKIPVFLETGFNAKAEYLREIREIENICRRFPELQVVDIHLGGQVLPPNDPNHVDNPAEFFELFKMGNFHLEFGYVLAWENEAVWGKDSQYPYPRHREMIRKIYERFGAGVMVWGADMPFAQRTCTYQQCIDTIRHHTEFMTEADRRLVLGGNVARLYRVESRQG